MKNRKFIIVGSGAGGAALAIGLAKVHKHNIVVIEEGKKFDKVGSIRLAAQFYDTYGLKKSVEGTIIHKTNMMGGTTVVSCGNMVRSLHLQREFLGLGIDLDEYSYEVERELSVTTSFSTTRTVLSINDAAHKLGYSFKAMPKAIKEYKCKQCSNCVLGCKFSSKWTALSYLDEAKAYGAHIIDQTHVIRVLNRESKVTGVEIINKKTGSQDVILGDVVILAAGGIGTPIILQKSGFDSAGKNLFCDLFNVTYGITKKYQHLGLSMPIVDMEFYESDGLILSPFMDPILQFAVFGRLKAFFYKRAIGIMTKIADECTGYVDADGIISKPVTKKDREKLDKGTAISKEILIEAGASPDSIFTTPVRGAHPGGTTAEIVDNTLETDIKNLYVCDASILPFAPGLPPILTIIALAKWLANRLT